MVSITSRRRVSSPVKRRPPWPVRVGSSSPILTWVLVLRRGVGWLLTRRCLRRWVVVEHFPVRIGTFVGLPPPLSPSCPRRTALLRRLRRPHLIGDAQRVRLRAYSRVPVRRQTADDTRLLEE